MITITKVVTRNFIMDFVAGFQNLMGMNLTSYERMAEKAIQQIKDELEDRQLKWYRYEMTQLTNGALSVTLYGDLK